MGYITQGSAAKGKRREVMCASFANLPIWNLLSTTWNNQGDLGFSQAQGLERTDIQKRI